MLRTVHVRRHAPNVSPFSEQRLLFAHTPDRRSGAEGGGMEGEEKNDVVQHIVDARTQFRKEIFTVAGEALLEFAENNSEKFAKITGKLLDIDSYEKAREIVGEVRSILKKEILQEFSENEQSIAELSKIDIDTMTEERCQEFLETHKKLAEEYLQNIDAVPARTALLQLEAILHWQIQHLKSQEIIRDGLVWQLHGEDGQKQALEKEGVKGLEINDRLPDAFIKGKRVHVNIDSQKLREDPTNITHTVAHEMAHHSYNGMGIEWQKRFVEKIKSKKEYAMLKESVHAVFHEQSNETGPRNNDDNRIVTEALAITIANDRYPRAEEGSTASQQNARQKEKKVQSIFQSIINADDTLMAMMRDWNMRYEKDMHGAPSVDAIEQSIEERNVMRQLEEWFGYPPKNIQADEKGKLYVSEEPLCTSTPDESTAEEMAKVLGSTNEKKKKEEERMTAKETANKIQTLEVKIKKINQDYLPLMKKGIAGAEDEKMLTSIVEKNAELVRESEDDLKNVMRYVDILSRWNENGSNAATIAEKIFVAEKQFPNENPYATLGNHPSIESIQAADEACQSQRTALLAQLKESIRYAENQIEILEKAMEMAYGAKDSQDTDSPGSDLWQWVKKNFFSSEGHVAYMTPLNIMKVCSIYKEAISEYYNSNQTSKVYDFAKNMNISKKIEHTLKKQARSANNDESGKFLDYLKDEGYTFDEIFGKNGDGKTDGVLYENRNNFNKAKAVINYAAEHAWLYKLDRFNGHDVYGIDFERIEGKQSFEELVESYEAAKGKEVDKGRKKVDKDPDVGPIMDMMVEELKAKNIFAVQGIMERLQGKGKWSHCNTWMLTTLLLRMRKDPELRVCFDKGMLDNVANSTIGQSAWSLTWLKIMRTPLMSWKESGLQEDFTKDNIATKVIVKIEDRLQKEGVEFPATEQGFKDRCEAIAVIMSCKTYGKGKDTGGKIKIEGSYAPKNPISIFDEEFSEYREKFRSYTSTTTTEPAKTDDDFFGGISDAMLLDETQTGRILDRKSTGEWTLATKARGFVSNIFNLDDELMALDKKDASKNFRKEMCQKMNFWMDSFMDDGRKKVFVKDRDLKGRIIYEEMHKRNLISSDHYNILKSMDPAMKKKEVDEKKTTTQQQEKAPEEDPKMKKAKEEERANEAAKKKIAQMGAQAA